MIHKALKNLRPGAEWSVSGDSYGGIEWLDKTQSKPSKSEIDAEMSRLVAEYANTEYQRLRSKEYPSIQDQLDMQYHDAVNGTTTWQDAINAVKAKYPKPEGV